jgi:hypothetical protein
MEHLKICNLMATAVGERGHGGKKKRRPSDWWPTVVLALTVLTPLEQELVP